MVNCLRETAARTFKVEGHEVNQVSQQNQVTTPSQPATTTSAKKPTKTADNCQRQNNKSEKCNKCQRQKTSCKMEKEHSWKRISDPVLPPSKKFCQRKQNKDNQQEQNDKLHN